MTVRSGGDVLMYLPGFRAGSPGHAIYRDLARAIRARGVDFALVTDDDGTAPPEGMETVVERRSRVLGRALAPLTRNRRFVAHVGTISRLVQMREPSVLHMEQVYPLGAAAEYALTRTASPARLTLQPSGEDVLVAPAAGFGFRRFALPRFLVRRALAQAAGVRCISPLVRRTVEPWSTGVVEEGPANVSWATVKLARRDADAIEEARGQARASLDAAMVAPGTRLVVGLGRLHPVKGFDQLIAAAARLPAVTVVLVGSALHVAGFGHTGRWLDGLAAAAGLGGRYRRIDWISHHDVPRLLAAADVVAAPSYTESQNRVCVEAAAVGTPFVVGSGAGIAGLLDRDGVGIVVPSGDPAALADALTAALPGGGWRRRPQASREWVERFSPEAAAASLERLWSRVLDRRRVSTGEEGP